MPLSATLQSMTISNATKNTMHAITCVMISQKHSNESCGGFCWEFCGGLCCAFCWERPGEVCKEFFRKILGEITCEPTNVCKTQGIQIFTMRPVIFHDPLPPPSAPLVPQAPFTPTLQMPAPREEGFANRRPRTQWKPYSIQAQAHKHYCLPHRRTDLPSRLSN